MDQLELTQFTEPSIVIGTLDPSFLWMCIQTFVSGRTVAILRVPPALWHSPEIIFMQELTGISFLTKSTEPMFTHCGKSLALARVSGELLRGLKIES